MDPTVVLALNPEPEIKIVEGGAIVKIVTVSPWEGFMRQSFLIQKEIPHDIQLLEIDTLIKYNCGILF